MAPRIMSTDKPKIIRLAVAGIALPIVFGVMIELACDSLKYVVHSGSSACQHVTHVAGQKKRVAERSLETGRATLARISSKEMASW